MKGPASTGPAIAGRGKGGPVSAEVGLEALLESAVVWRARAPSSATRAGREAPVVASGWPALDAALPDGGWPLGTLVEVLLPQPGVGELRLLLPALRTLALAGEPRWFAWIAPPHAPYPPALAQDGLDPARLLLIEADPLQDRLWAMEQALQSHACQAVLGWLDGVDDRWLRRLKLAAESGRALAVLFRPLRRREQASPAVLRLVLEPLATGLDVQVMKSRGGRPQRIRNVLRA